MLKVVFNFMLVATTVVSLAGCSQGVSGLTPATRAVPLDCDTVLCGDPSGGCPLAVKGRVSTEDLCGGDSDANAVWVTGVCASAEGAAPNCLPGYWADTGYSCETCVPATAGDMCATTCSGGGPIACNGTASSCANVSCSGSPESIGDYFRDPATNASIQVTDINSIWQNGSEVGWLYLGSNGTRYIQANYSTQAGVSWGLSFGFASASVAPGTYGPIKQWGGGLPPGSAVQKCESNGGQLA
jgi:hypothetical protein